jgi:cytidine deaminase
VTGAPPPVPGISAEEAERLLGAAGAMAVRAYAPYSGLRIGAALLSGTGAVYGGCNVENASLGLTMCAERNALAAAVAAEGADRLAVRAVAVRTSDLAACPPCGACRQVLAELAPGAVVLFETAEGPAARTVAELLPDRFSLPPG